MHWRHFLCKIERREKRDRVECDLCRYKGKGASRSDEIGDEKRVYAKFKVKSNRIVKDHHRFFIHSKGNFRIREVSADLFNVDRNRMYLRRKSISPMGFSPPHHHH